MFFCFLFEQKICLFYEFLHTHHSSFLLLLVVSTRSLEQWKIFPICSLNRWIFSIEISHCRYPCDICSGENMQENMGGHRFTGTQKNVAINMFTSFHLQFLQFYSYRLICSTDAYMCLQCLLILCTKQAKVWTHAFNHSSFARHRKHIPQTLKPGTKTEKCWRNRIVEQIDLNVRTDT